MLQKPTKQVYAFATESWESAESKFTSTCTGKGGKSIRSSPAREDTDTVTEKERERKRKTQKEREILLFLSIHVSPDVLFSLVFNAS